MNIFVFDHKLKTNAQHESEIANIKILKGNSCQTVTFSNSEFGWFVISNQYLNSHSL